MKKQIIKQKRKKIKWNHPEFGLIEATICDNKLRDFRACETGSSPTICNSNIHFLHALRDALTDVLNEVS